MASIHGGVFISIGVIVGVTTIFQPVLWPFRWFAAAFIIYGAAKILIIRSKGTQHHHHQPVHHRPQHHVPQQVQRPQPYMYQQTMQQQVPQQMVQQRICANCKRQIPAAYRFCPYCGYGV
ncbi:MAG TPA: zinc-ribbon domain-containing protein [Acidobacteriota bacterium]|nr:zinc-ribbon domain-containing protein [Acidobacteriota bacterium]